MAARARSSSPVIPDGPPRCGSSTSGSPAAGHVHYLHVTPGSDVTEIDIRLRPDGKDRTIATVRYTWTALGEPGLALVRSKTPESYRRFMQEWERELNHFLTTGKKLPEGH